MSNNNVTSRLELLRMARELVINEYIDKRAQDHNRWLSEADVAWRTRGIKLAYPPFPHYPTEVDIVTRATALGEFLNGPVQKEPNVVKNDEATIVSVKPQEVKPIIEETKLTDELVPVSVEPVVDHEVTQISPVPVEPVAEDVEVKNKNEGKIFEKMIPPVLAKIDQFKSTWAIR